MEGRSRGDLAPTRLHLLTAALTRYRDQRRPCHIARSLAVTVLIWLIFAFVVRALRWFYKRALILFEHHYNHRTTMKKWFGTAIPLAVRTLLFAISVLVALAALSAAISHSLAFFPATAGYSGTFIHFFQDIAATGLRRVSTTYPISPSSF